MTEPGTWYHLAGTGRRVEERRRLEALQSLADPTSHSRLALVQVGWRCLEVGAGLGSIAAWLANRVGVTGQVTATDRDVTLLESIHDANVEVLQHDIVRDPIELLGLDCYQLAHARSVLVHTADALEIVVRRLVQCLAPGGWLVCEESDFATLASANPWHPLAARFDEVFDKVRSGLERSGAVNLTCGRQLCALFARVGLGHVRHEATAQVVAGGSPLSHWLALTLAAERDSRDSEAPRFLSDDDIDDATTALADPSFYVMHSIGHCAWGQKA